MKKTVLTILVLCTMYFVLSTGTRAQTFDFNEAPQPHGRGIFSLASSGAESLRSETSSLTLGSTPGVFAEGDKAYQDHLYNLTLYNQAYSDYQDAKNSYLANKTLSLKEDARQKTLIMLMSRNQMMAVYMQMLKQKVVEDRGLSNEDKNNIFVKIDSEVDWYKNDKEKYNTNDSLETLFGRSEEARTRYKTNTLLTIDEALVDIGLGEEITLRNEHEAVYSTLKTIIDAGVASGKLTLNPFNHWLTDIDATDSVLKQNESDVRTRIQKIYDQSYSPQGSFEASMEILSLGVPQLSQFNKFLTEVLNYIKNQQ